MRRIYWDTMLYVYWFDDNPQFATRVRHIYHSMVERGDQLCTSPFIVGETLVGPVKRNDLTATALIENFFSSHAVEMLSYLPAAARTFAGLRAEHGVKAIDAVHLATASAANVDLFLTNDRRLHALSVPGIRFIATLETDLF